MKRLVFSVLVVLLGSLLLISCTNTAPIQSPAQTTQPAPAPTAPGPTHEVFRFPILTAPFGGGGYELGLLIEQEIAKVHPWLRPITQESAGLVYNVTEMAGNNARWKTTVADLSPVTFWAAREGIQPFFSQPIKGTEDLRWFFTWMDSGIFFITQRDDIQSFYDLANKHVGLGGTSQTHYTMFPMQLFELAGIKDTMKIDLLGGNAQIQEAFINGRIDAAPVSALFRADYGKASAAIAQNAAAAGRKFRYISIPEELIRKHNDELRSPMVTYHIPAGTLPQQEKEVTAMGGAEGFVAHKDFPVEAAREFTKTTLELVPRLEKLSALAALFSPEGMAKLPKGAEFHPGALEAFQEAKLAK